jgi:hypothetical protein
MESPKRIRLEIFAKEFLARDKVDGNLRSPNKVKNTPLGARLADFEGLLHTISSCVGQIGIGELRH